jgi:hypothetical protein
VVGVRLGEDDDSLAEDSGAEVPVSSVGSGSSSSAVPLVVAGADVVGRAEVLGAVVVGSGGGVLLGAGTTAISPVSPAGVGSAVSGRT